MEQEMGPEETRGALGAWQNAVQHAQTGRLDDLEANLGKLSEDEWNAMVNAAEEAWENAQQCKPAALEWLKENAEAIDNARVMDLARGIIDYAEAPSAHEMMLNVGAVGIPMKLDEVKVEFDPDKHDTRYMARNSVAWGIWHQHDEDDIERRRMARELIYAHFHSMVMAPSG